MNICETCRVGIDPSATDVLYAVELIDAGTLDDPSAMIEGLGVFFHMGCWPGGSGYRRKPKPESTKASSFKP